MSKMERFANAGFTFDVTDTSPVDGTGIGQVAILLHGFPQDRHRWDAVTPGYPEPHDQITGRVPGPPQTQITPRHIGTSLPDPPALTGLGSTRITCIWS
jgi:hypothetical protein